MKNEVRRNRSRNNYDGRSGSRSSYVYGSAAPKVDVRPNLDVRRAIEEKEVKRLSHTARKNREKASHMNLGYVIFLTMAMIVAASVLIGYINLQASNTAAIENIASLESQLDKVRLSNNEEYSRAISSIDLDEVKRIAMEELGMKYAKEGQVITVEGVDEDYVRQYASMP